MLPCLDTLTKNVLGCWEYRPHPDINAGEIRAVCSKCLLKNESNGP